MAEGSTLWCMRLFPAARVYGVYRVRRLMQASNGSGHLRLQSVVVHGVYRIRPVTQACNGSGHLRRGGYNKKTTLNMQRIQGEGGGEGDTR